MPAMASRSGSRRRSMNEINMVPFIDVMLVLLIIFMVTATVITPGAINVPTAGTSQKAPDKRIDVLINHEGEPGWAPRLRCRMLENSSMKVSWCVATRSMSRAKRL